MAKLTAEVRWEFGQDSAKSQVLDVASFRQQVFWSMYRPSSQNLMVSAFFVVIVRFVNSRDLIPQVSSKLFLSLHIC